MWYIIGFIIIFIIWGLYNESNLKNKGIIYHNEMSKYLGGFDDREGGKRINLKITNNEMILEFANGDKVKLPFIKINNIRIMTEQSITSEVNAGKFLVFGIMSFAMQDKVTTVKNYLIINLKGDNPEGNFNIILDTPHKEEIVKLVREKLNSLN